MTHKKQFHIFSITVIIGIAAFLLGCASAPKDYVDYKQIRPRSILVMPPLNNTVDISASPIFLAASVKPLAESGYYVIPVALSQEMFRQNGIYTAADANEISHKRLNEIFGADSALYITITKFGAVFQLVRSVVQAEAEAKLVDLKTGTLLWSGSVFVEESPSNTQVSSSGGLAAQLLLAVGAAIVDQVANNLTKASYGVGFRAAETLLDARYPKSLLYGPYHPEYETD
ncbi:MAG: DUF799 domain-containing protein [Treponema sp.]|nr:DUF799 domain-containing protein [Treponema sp.]